MAMEARVDQGTDRRRHERFSFSSVLEVCRSDEAHAAEARAHDVSVGGLSFVTQAELKVGDLIRLGLPNSEGAAFKLEATVRYVRPDPDGGYFVGAERRAN
jgi:hypothetical protein